MKLHIALPKSRFVAAEDILLHVALTNDGPEPVQMPDPFHGMSGQPVYTVVGPEPPQSYTFSFRSAISEDKQFMPSDADDDDIEFVTLEPGETLEEDVPLHEWAPRLTPGTYHIVAHLRWQDVATVSEFISFTLEPLKIRAIATGVDVGTADESDVEVAFLHEADGEIRLYEALFVEERFERGMFERWSVESVGPAPEARDVLMPWTNFDRETALYNWHAWQTDTALYALFLMEEEPQHLDLMKPLDAVVRPALMTRSGTLDLFALSEGGREVVMVRFFPPDAEGVIAPPCVFGRTTLPVPATGARCVLTPPTSNHAGNSVLIFTAQHQEGVLVFSLRATEKIGPGPDQTIIVPGFFSIPCSQPALYVASDDTVHAAFLLANDPALRDLALARVTYGPDGSPITPPEITKLDPLPARSRAATVAFQVLAGGTPRPEWVVLLDTEDPTIVSSQAPSRVQPLKAQPALPLELLPRTKATYLLIVDSIAGPTLVPLR